MLGAPPDVGQVPGTNLDDVTTSGEVPLSSRSSTVDGPIRLMRARSQTTGGSTTCVPAIQDNTRGDNRSSTFVSVIRTWLARRNMCRRHTNAIPGHSCSAEDTSVMSTSCSDWRCANQSENGYDLLRSASGRQAGSYPTRRCSCRSACAPKFDARSAVERQRRRRWPADVVCAEPFPAVPSGGPY